jgi:hypothetical protein
MCPEAVPYPLCKVISVSRLLGLFPFSGREWNLSLGWLLYSGLLHAGMAWVGFFFLYERKHQWALISVYRSFQFSVGSFQAYLLFAQGLSSGRFLRRALRTLRRVETTLLPSPPSNRSPVLRGFIITLIHLLAMSFLMIAFLSEPTVRFEVIWHCFNVSLSDISLRQFTAILEYIGSKLDSLNFEMADLKRVLFPITGITLMKNNYFK